MGRPTPVSCRGVCSRTLALRAAIFCLSENFLTSSQSTERPNLVVLTAETWRGVAVKEKKCWKHTNERSVQTLSPTQSNNLSASQTLRVSIITSYPVHSSKVCGPVDVGSVTVAPFFMEWRHPDRILTSDKLSILNF